MRSLPLPCVLPLVLVLGGSLACGSDAAQASAAGTPATSSTDPNDVTDGGGSSSSGGPNAPTTTADGGTTAPTETKSGVITITSSSYTAGTTPVETGVAYGAFYRIPPAPAGAAATSCTTTNTGACTLTACTYPPSQTDAGAPAVAYTDAGVVTVTGVRVDGGSITIGPGKYGYETVARPNALFKGGESIGVSAPGNPGGGPAFDVTLKAPSAVILTAPVFDASSTARVGAGQALPVAWQKGGGGDVSVLISAATPERNTFARCAFPAAAGQGSVPASVLDAVAAVGALTGIVVSSEARQELTEDGWGITVSLLASATRSGGGGIASGYLERR
jgi:hypothetical protein